MTLEIIPIKGIGDVIEGTRLSDLVPLDVVRSGDVLVATSKIVSKAEGQIVPCAEGDIDARRRLIERESVRVLRRRGELLISETVHGFICANAGIDFSNVGTGMAALLPKDPDNSAHRLRNGVKQQGLEVGVIISDTFGRTWRSGATDIALGCAGLRPILDLRGTNDMYEQPLRSTEICLVDQLASAAELVMGKSSGIPMAIVRGVSPEWFGEGSVRHDVVRRANSDLFR